MVSSILFTSVIILICILASKLSGKVGIPSLLLFMLLGMFFGSDGIVKIYFDDYAFAEQICSVLLIFIMFYGGFGTNWKAARPVAVPSFLLASLGVFLTAGITGWFCYKILHFKLIESMLIGSVISSTDAASVFAILRSKNLNLKNGLASLLELESGSNDPAAYMLTVIFLGIITGGNDTPIFVMILSQILFGVMIGTIIAMTAVAILKKVHFDNGMDTIFMVAVALLAYSLTQIEILGGNGYLSVYVSGIILGNSPIRNKITLVHFFDGVTGLMQFLLFFLLGLLSFPSHIPNIIIPSILIALFLTFIGRPISIFLLMLPFPFSLRDKLLVSWAGLRGAASIVFAIMVTVSDISVRTDIFHIVFCVALLSVTFQGTLLPIFAKKLDLVDDDGSVMKTFTDYVDETDMELLQIQLSAGHDWVGKKLSQIVFPVDSLVVMIERGSDTVIPKGNTVFKESDKVILSSKKYENYSDVSLREEQIPHDHPWANQAIKNIDFHEKLLIVMIKRDDNTIIPKGDTTILENDVLVLRTATS